MSKNILSRLNAAKASTSLKLADQMVQPKLATEPKSVLHDLFGRKHSYLRVSLTERCNLRCTYCMPEEGVPLTANEKLLSADEIVKLVNFFAKLGVNKIRFTGGEPMVRKDCVDIIRQVGQNEAIKKIGMTTNGIVLSRKINELKEAGLNQLNISLDTLKEKKFEFVTKRKGWSKVMKSIDSALDLGFSPLKINCVVMKGLNDDEITDFIEFTKDKNVDVRFIEYMPFDGNKWNTKKMVSFKEMMKIIAQKYPIESINKLQDDPNDTSKAFKIDNYSGQFGFITSMSEHFCHTCNRIRLTADGNLKVCLFGNSEVSLRDAIRKNMNDEDLSELISAAIKRKKAKHAGLDVLPSLKNRPMILIDNRLKQTFKTNLLNVNIPNFLPHLYPRIAKHQPVSLYSTDTFDEHTKLWDQFKTYNEKIVSQRIPSSHSFQFTHLDNETNLPKQVDISEKKQSESKPVRVACASGYIQLNKDTFNALVENKLKKGNALIVAQIAGIQASKQTQNLIPLCHQILLDVCDINFFPDENEFRIRCEAICKTSTSKTGVEVEALTACSVALLTLYDMCKAIQKDAVIHSIQVEYKYGGKSDYKRNF